MKKLAMSLMAGVLAFSCAFSVAGCSLLDEEKTSEQEKSEIYDAIESAKVNEADKTFTGTLKIAYEDVASEVTIMDSILDAFSKEYPNITIVRQATVESNYITLMQNNHAAAVRQNKFTAMPDIIWTTNEILAGWVDQDMLMPLNYFDDKDDSFSAEDTFLDTMLQDSKLGDNLYMFPRDYDQIVMYYNRNLLKLAGISEDRIHSDRALTADEFNALLKDIRDAFKGMSGTNPLNKRSYSQVRSLDALFAWGSLCWPTLKSFGGSVVDTDGTVKFNTEENIAAATYVRELIANEYIFNGGTQYAQFTNQLTALCFTTRAVLTELIKSTDSVPGVAAEDLGVAPMPMLGNAENYSIGAGCSGYGMYKYAENQTAAWLFLKFLASENGQNAFCSTGNGVPSNKNMLYDENATWRNISGGDFDKLTNFNHDAFIYAWDTAACTLQDFKLNIDVVKARETVSTDMTNVMSSCLSTSPNTYKADIRKKFEEGEKTIYQHIEGLRND